MCNCCDKKTMSIRGRDWSEFSNDVLNHIENYTVPQYGDKGEDQATDYTVPELLKQAKKYIERHGKNQRPGQEQLDMLKAAHYIQMAATKMKEEADAAA